MQNLYDIEIEAFIFSHALNHYNDFNKVASELRLEDFFDETHQNLFSILLDIYNEGLTYNLDNVRLKASKDLEKVGGLEYLIKLNSLSESLDIDYLIEKIKEKSKLREIFKFGQSLQEGTKQKIDFEDFLSSASSRASKVFNNINEKSLYSIQEAITKYDPYKVAVTNKERKESGLNVVNGIPSFYKDLDDKISGFSSGHLIIIGARPSVGKSTLMLNFMNNMDKCSIAVFTLEMTTEQLLSKLTCLKAEVSYKSFKNGLLTSEDIQNIHGHLKQIGERKIFIDEQPSIKPCELLGRARHIKAMHGLDIIFVDYLQLMQADEKKQESNEVKISSISRELKTIAKLLDVPIVALAQLNREVEKRDKKRPKCSDLRESGSLEADADLIFLLSRPAMNDDILTDNVIEINVDKNRFGERGIVNLYFDVLTGKMSNYAQEKCTNFYYSSFMDK